VEGAEFRRNSLVEGKNTRTDMGGRKISSLSLSPSSINLSRSFSEPAEVLLFSF
jgi:hypothetical protein